MLITYKFYLLWKNRDVWRLEVGQGSQVKVISRWKRLEHLSRLRATSRWSKLKIPENERRSSGKGKRWGETTAQGEGLVLNKHGS